MKTQKWRVSAPFSEAQSRLLLRLTSPSFDNVFCYGVTYAYGVGPDYPFPEGPLTLVLDGYHRGEDHDCLTGGLQAPNGWLIRQRPDGKLIHVTLSTAPGTPPARASEIIPHAIERIDPISLDVALGRGYPKVYQPRGQGLRERDQSFAA